MNKLYLKSNIKDDRSITADLINEVDKEISNKKYFLTQMNELGYEEKYMDVLVKYFNQYEVNINLQTTDVDVIDNIVLSEDKDLIKIICEKYQLNGIKVDSENIGDQIDKMINNSEKVLFYYDIKNLGINLDEIKYVINSKIID